MSSQLAERPTPASLPAGRGKGPGGQPLRSLRPGQCPVAGCGDPIDATRLMCRRDWNLLPAQLRDQVWVTWRSGHGAASREHQQAGSRQSPRAVQPGCRPGNGSSPGSCQLHEPHRLDPAGQAAAPARGCSRKRAIYARELRHHGGMAAGYRTAE